MFKRKGGGVKGLLNNFKKTALFLMDGFPKRFGSLGIILIYLVLQTIIFLYAELRRQQLCVNITFMSAELRIGVKNPGRFPAKLTRPNVVPDLIMMLVVMRLVAMMTCLVR